MKSFQKNTIVKKSKLISLVILNIVGKIVVIFIPYCLQYMIDAAVSKNVATFNHYGILMCLLYAANILLQTFYSYQLDLAQEKSVLEIKEQILTNIQNEDLNQFKKHNISYYYQRFTSDADECRFLFYERNITIVSNFVFLILLLFIMLKMSWELTLIIVILTIIFLIVKNKILPIIEEKQKTSIESDENLNAFFEEYVDGQETIRNFSKFSNFKIKFAEKQSSVFKAFKEHTWIDTIFDIVLMTSILNAADIISSWENYQSVC